MLKNMLAKVSKFLCPSVHEKVEVLEKRNKYLEEMVAQLRAEAATKEENRNYHRRYNNKKNIKNDAV